MQTVDKNNRSALERFLNLFAEVRSGEAGNTLLLTLSIFLILTSYYIAKVLREQWILTGGAELKSYSSALQAITLIFCIGAYAKLVARLDRRRLLNYVTAFFILGFGVFYLLGKAEIPYIEVAFFVFIGIFNLTIIAQFWSFANDIHTPEEGKRLFAIIAFGGSLGAVLGAKIPIYLTGIVGDYEHLLLAAVLLAFSLMLVMVVDSRRRQVISQAAGVKSQLAGDADVGRSGAFRVVFRSRYLLMIALLILLLNWVNSSGQYILDKIVTTNAQDFAAATGGTEATMLEARKLFIKEFSANYLFWINTISLVVQLFIVSRVVRWFGIRTAIMILPLFALGGYLAVAIVPVLAAIRFAKIGENAGDYSINNTARQMLFLPTTREEKYKAKVAIDSFFVRVGDVLSAGVVYAGSTWLTFKAQHFAIVNVVLVVLWLILAVAIGKENRRLMAAADSANAKA